MPHPPSGKVGAARKRACRRVNVFVRSVGATIARLEPVGKADLVEEVHEHLAGGGDLQAFGVLALFRDEGGAAADAAPDGEAAEVDAGDAEAEEVELRGVAVELSGLDARLDVARNQVAELDPGGEEGADRGLEEGVFRFAITGDEEVVSDVRALVPFAAEAGGQAETVAEYMARTSGQAGAEAAVAFGRKLEIGPLEPGYVALGRRRARREGEKGEKDQDLFHNQSVLPSFSAM